MESENVPANLPFEISPMKQSKETVLDVIDEERRNAVDDADILSIAIERSSKKARLREVLNSNDDDDELYYDRNLLSHKFRSSRLSDAGILSMAMEGSSRKLPPPPRESVDSHDDIAATLFCDEAPVQSPSEEASLGDDTRRRSTKKRLKERIISTIEKQLLDILNDGTYEQLKQLYSIGHVRANKILAMRSEKEEIALADLVDIGMTPAMVNKLFQSNFGKVVNSLDIM